MPEQVVQTNTKPEFKRENIRIISEGVTDDGKRKVTAHRLDFKVIETDDAGKVTETVRDMVMIQHWYLSQYNNFVRSKQLSTLRDGREIKSLAHMIPFDIAKDLFGKINEGALE